MSQKKYMTDRHLLKLWRQAVLKEYNNQCLVCGNGNTYELECHHIVKRGKNKVLKYDIWNGVPVCKYSCHRWVDSLRGKDFLESKIPEKMEYLKKYEMVHFKQYLLENEMSENEFLKMKHEEIKGVLCD
jgi:Pyruvate/2-oxoacid:ferredoxin oxidoreductase delta subunit